MPSFICGKDFEKYLDGIKERCVLVRSSGGSVSLYDYDEKINVNLDSADGMFQSYVDIDYQQAKELADFIYKRLELHKETKNEG